MKMLLQPCSPLGSQMCMLAALLLSLALDEESHKCDVMGRHGRQLLGVLLPWALILSGLTRTREGHGETRPPPQQ